MRNIVIYGPPASGKLTVGRELARQTGYRLVHNHLSIDLARNVFDFGAPGFWPLVSDIRLAMVTRAAEHGVDLISTYVYSPKENQGYLDAIRGAVNDAGGTTLFVQLRPPREVLAERVAALPRVAARKLVDPAALLELVEQWDLYGMVDPGDLAIDNSLLPPAEVADAIRAHFAIPAREEASGQYREGGR